MLGGSTDLMWAGGMRHMIGNIVRMHNLDPCINLERQPSNLWYIKASQHQPVTRKSPSFRIKPPDPFYLRFRTLHKPPS